MNVTAYDLGARFMDIKEEAGPTLNNPAIMAMLKLDNSWPENDEVPWCSAFVNYIAWLLDLPRSKNLMARSWLTVGQPVALARAKQGYDVAIFRRGGGQAGPEVLNAPGHVGFFHSNTSGRIKLLGGNQGNTVSLANFPEATLLGVRRLY